MDISKKGKEVKGDFFTYQQFTVKLHIKKDCLANLAEGFAVNKVRFCTESELSLYTNKESLIFEEYKAGDTVTISGLLYSPEIEKNKELIKEDRNCLYYLMPKAISPVKNETESCNILNSYFNYGLSYIKNMNETKYNEMMELNSKAQLKSPDKMGVLLIGYSLVKMKLFKMYNETKELDFNSYIEALLNTSINMFYAFESKNLNCKFTRL